MKRLTVLYDDECAFCLRCAAWLRRQAQLVPLELLALSDARARYRYPSLIGAGASTELTVVSEAGSVYAGPKAFLMALWALKRYRIWSVRLASPDLLPLARGAFNILSKRRGALSWLFGPAQNALLRAELRPSARAPTCRGECR